MNSETRTIGDAKVTARKLSSTESYRLLPSVMKMIAPMIGAGFTANALSQAIDVLAADVDQKLLARVMSCVTVTRGGKVHDLADTDLIDAALPDIEDLIDAFRLSLEVNYRRFFSRGLAALAGEQAKAAPESSLTPTP